MATIAMLAALTLFTTAIGFAIGQLLSKLSPALAPTRRRKWARSKS